MTAPRRPVLRYLGGKWRLAPWLLGFMPAHRIYVEPYGGGASVLLRKPRSYAEVHNDLDSEVVNVFRVLRDLESAARLRIALELTPYAREEYELAYEPSDDPVERARQTIVKSFMGFGSASIHAGRPRGMRTRATTWPAATGFNTRAISHPETERWSTGYRGNANRSGTTPAHDWSYYPMNLPALVERLSGVVIENRPALDLLPIYNKLDALIYCDPPYLFRTRQPGKRGRQRPRQEYAHEMTEVEHSQLAEALCSLSAMVMVSGYPDPVYEELYRGWERRERKHLADGARVRTEVVWLNPACANALRDKHHQHEFLEAAR